MFKNVMRPALFQLSHNDPETAHILVMRQLALAARVPTVLKIIAATSAYQSPKLAREVFGLRFPNPVGLAAGFDKNGHALAALAALGFGFIEAGGVTRFAQPGQPRPRIFRLSADEALINRMGLPSEGATVVAARLAQQSKVPVPIGWQIAKSKVTPLDDAVEDYLHSLRALYPFGDYFSVNVSSPNTPDLARLQERDRLAALLQAIVGETQRLAATAQATPKPVLVKLSPDLTWNAIDEALDVCLAAGVRGVIATNTTTTREHLTTPTDETGGLSGHPLAARALAVVRHICQRSAGALPVVGVGGILGPDDAKRMFDAGAALIQIYTGFIYAGPAIVKRINRALAEEA